MCKALHGEYGLGWGGNRVISVFRLQCLPTNPKIDTHITSNPHNLYLQVKIITNLYIRQIQGNTISSIGGGRPNVSVFSLPNSALVRCQQENFI